MPLAPTATIVDPERARDYKDAGRRLDQLAQAGYSWSGRERNCAYLNTGRGRFANISAAAGLDFTDDGRSLAVVDWDHDGDLDLWAANRTGPRLRFLRNDTDSENHFVAVRLQGRSANRDAIGARVEVTRHDDGVTIRKTLRAGEGFLGQSSKWLHFGLGPSQRVDRLVVHWPGGDVQAFTDLAANQHYRIVEGQPQVQSWSPPARVTRLKAAEISEPPSSGDARIRLRARLPLPPWDYLSFEGVVDSHVHSAPILLVLWSSTCQPCVEELMELTRASSQLREMGVSVIALTVDAMSDGASAEDAQRLLQSMSFPFAAGKASIGLVEKLQLVHDDLFKPHRPLSVPASFLIDASGQLAAIYKGRVSIADLADDVASLQLDSSQLLEDALPFDGRWFNAPRSRQLLPLAASLIEGDFVDDVVRYVESNRAEFERDPGFHELLNRIGRSQLDRGETGAAIASFREALQIRPDDADACYNLGIAQVASNNLGEAIRCYEQALRIDPTHFKAINNLANAYLARGEIHRAEKAYQEALEVNPDLPDVHFNLATLYLSRKRVELAKKHFGETIRLAPHHARALNNLGIMLASEGQSETAIDHYRRAVAADPGYAQAHNNLATVLALVGDLDEAITHYRQAVRTQPELVDAHRNLAQTLVARNRHSEALPHLRAVVQLKPDAESMATLAWVLATRPQSEERDATEALRWAEQAVDLAQHDPGVLDALAVAQAAAGHYEDAISTSQEAIRILEEADRADLAAEVRQRQALYKQQAPYRISPPRED